jgi:anti-anti-sigma factor
MTIRVMEPHVLYAPLAAEPHLQKDLEVLRTRVRALEGTHVIVDLSNVDTITSPSIGSLVLLYKFLHQRGQRLILCRTRLVTQSILYVAGLSDLFEFAADNVEALALLHDPGTEHA